jgi:hypothetical protein
MTEHEEVIRGHAAQDLIDNPLFKGAVSAVREGIVQAISTSPMGDESTHNRLAIALQLINQIEKQLKTHIETGRMASLQIRDGIGPKLRRVVGM